MSLARHMCGNEESLCLTCGCEVELPADYCEKHSALGELLEAAIWAERAIAPFSREPDEESGISRLRKAIARAEAEQ